MIYVLFTVYESRSLITDCLMIVISLNVINIIAAGTCFVTEV